MAQDGLRRRGKSPGGRAESSANGAAATVAGSGAGAPPTLLVNKKDKWKSWRTRTFYTLLMISSFLTWLSYMNQLGCILVVFVCQAVMYKELVSIAVNEAKERQLPWGRAFYAYYFMVVCFFVYGRTLDEHLLLHTFEPHLGVRLSDVFRYHSLIAFLLYAAGVVAFVLNLRKQKLYKYQFKTFAFCHVVLLCTTVQSTFLVANMFSGLIWFLLPVSLVCCNDIWAYIFGFFFGRTPLIHLSPKKTWEGFIGGAAATFVWGFFFARFLSQFDVMVCPKRGLNPFDVQSCAPHAVFDQVPAVARLSALAGSLDGVLRIEPGTVAAWCYSLPFAPLVGSTLLNFTCSGFQLHTLVLALFASSVAPFGGFFASGFKRAFRIKDFGNSIPGHGGITDRMDCQIIMGAFVYVYMAACFEADAMDHVKNRILTLSVENQRALLGWVQRLVAETH